MSVEGFVAKSEERVRELEKRIREIVKADGGREIYAHFRKERMEVKKLNEAIWKATRKGLRE